MKKLSVKSFESSKYSAIDIAPEFSRLDNRGTGVSPHDFGADFDQMGAAAEIQLYIESPLESGDTIETIRHLRTPLPYTRIKVRAQITGSNEKPPNSPAFLAAKRRRASRNIIKSITSLTRWAEDPDFCIWTQAVVSQLKAIIRFLDTAAAESEKETEGNSCEVLRQVRDSFLRTGWEKYRSQSVRNQVVKLLSHLSTEEVITAEFADESMDVILDLGLEPVVMPTIEDENEDKVSD